MEKNPSSDSVQGPWKQRLYDAYVSSGQARISSSTAERALKIRRAYYMRLISKYIPADRATRILDIGCGYGAFLHFLAAAGYTNASGVDRSAEQIDFAEKLGVANVCCRPAFDHICELSSASLDVVVLFDILEHLKNRQLLNMLEQVHRILAPGGICLVHVPNGAGLFGMRVRFGDLTHTQAFTESSAQQLFSTLGFANIQCFEEHPTVHGAVSAVRRLLWDAGTIPFRLLQFAESPGRQIILSQNILIRATRPASAH